MNIFQKLFTVQFKLKAPKSQYNDFGKYRYRSCEDILEAVKPLAAEVKAITLLSDELVMIGARYYIKATAMFVDAEAESSPVIATAYAREDETKKGMDGSQITGTASSYARKYALNALFCIDDTKDSDAAIGATEPPINELATPALPPDVCPACSRRVTPAYSQRQGRELSGAEIIAGFGGVCRECSGAGQAQ